MGVESGPAAISFKVNRGRHGVVGFPLKALPAAPLPSNKAETSSLNQVGRNRRIIKHEAVPQCGSFEVRFPDDRPSQYFYWDDIPARRMRPETWTVRRRW
jgi:hypothetical protein